MLKKGANLERRYLNLQEIEAYKKDIFAFYKQIADKAEMNMAVAQAEYFVQLKKEMGDVYQVLAYFLKDKFVGFISIFCHHKQHLEAHFIGYDRDLNREYAIYNNLLYDIVKKGIEKKVKTIALGRSATEIKSTLGAKACTFNSFMQHEKYISNKMIPALINHFRNDEWTLRQPFKQNDK